MMDSHIDLVADLNDEDDDGQVHFTVLPRFGGEEPPPHRPRPSLNARQLTAGRILFGYFGRSKPSSRMRPRS
jgi:hypothetical protein